MVLGFYGIDADEVGLSLLLGKTPAGTEMLNIELLENSDIGVSVETGFWDAERVQEHLDSGAPVIVMVKTAALPYWNADRPHAVVVVGYGDASVYLNDPKFPDAPKSVTWDAFLTAWEEFGRFGAVIRKQRQ